MRKAIISSSLVIALALGGCSAPEQTAPLCPEGTYYEADEGECEDTLEDALDLDGGARPKPKPTVKPTAKPVKPVSKPAPKPAPKPSKPRK